MRILPSKKVLSVFILMTALVAAVIIAFGKDKSSEIIYVANNLASGDKIKISENTNWQSELININANTEKIKVEETTPVEGTVTDTLSRSLISNYLAMKQSGVLDQSSVQKLMEQSLSYIEQSNIQTVITQFNIISDNGKQTIESYGENLGNITKIKSVAEIKEDTMIVMQMFQSPDTTKTSKINDIIISYEDILTRLIKMPVPKTFVKAHTDIVNGTNGVISSFRAIGNISEDPIKGLAALQSYQTNIITLSQAINATVVFIKQNNITYKQGSGGYYLLYGI